MIAYEDQDDLMAKIGNLNGKWSILFRALMAVLVFVIPFVVALNVWFVVTIYEIKLVQIGLITKMDSFMSPGERYTPEMATADMEQLRNEIIKEMRSQNPPQWLREQVSDNKERIRSIEQIFLEHRAQQNNNNIGNQ